MTIGADRIPERSDAHARTTKLLTEKKAEVEKVAKMLLEKEVITR